MDVCFQYSYGGFLQPIQAALGWKRIVIDVAKCFRSAKRLAMMVYDELLRKLMVEWVIELKEESFEVVYEEDVLTCFYTQLWQYSTSTVLDCLTVSWTKFNRIDDVQNSTILCCIWEDQLCKSELFCSRDSIYSNV